MRERQSSSRLSESRKISNSLLKTEAKGADVSAEQEIAILQRMIKQRKDSLRTICIAKQNRFGRSRSCTNESDRAVLPAQLTAEELEAEIKKIITETGAESIKDLGKVMGTASKALAGKSDGKSISEMVKKIIIFKPVVHLENILSKVANH